MQRWDTDFGRAPLWRNRVIEMELLSRDLLSRERDVCRSACDRVREALNLGKHPADIYRSARATLSYSLPSGRKFILAKAVMRLLEDMEDSGELALLARERLRRTAFLAKTSMTRGRALGGEGAHDRLLAREERKSLRHLRREMETDEDFLYIPLDPLPRVGCSRKYKMEQSRLKFMEQNRLKFMDEKDEADALGDDWEQKWLARI